MSTPHPKSQQTGIATRGGASLRPRARRIPNATGHRAPSMSRWTRIAVTTRCSESPEDLPTTRHRRTSPNAAWWTLSTSTSNRARRSRRRGWTTLRRTRSETRIATARTSRRLRETMGTTGCSVGYFQYYYRITKFNRQPSLHKMSTTSHRVGLMSYSSTFFPLSIPDALI